MTGIEKLLPEEGTDPQKDRKSRKDSVRRTLLTGFAFIVGFVIVGVIAITVWDFSNSVTFCAEACHDVHPEEIPAYQDSYHANVKCTECHMGRVGTLRNIMLKASHFKHLPAVVFDEYERPLESATMRPANESCELCHWPPAFHGDTVREITRFQTDEQNTPKDTYLILKTGAGTREKGLGYGIHWHITNPVEYIASDKHKQDIRWIRTTLPNGRIVEYEDVTNPLTDAEKAQAETYVMDCVDCHNRVGHPFPAPEDLVDEALIAGDLNPELPYVKKVILELLTAEYDTQEDALDAVQDVEELYKGSYPEEAALYAQDVEDAAALAENLITRLVFEEPGVNWQSFADQNKHKDFPGCFRCHDGKHLSSEGESIRLHCNICHSVPVTVGTNEPIPAAPLATTIEPDSHLETNFIADHRFQANAACEECHGKMSFGSDDSSFCASSSCHGKPWPAVELDAAFPHPIELEGKHAETWCHNCHEGVRKPEYVCANCHDSPQPHFGENCEDCHTPAGFQEADWGDFVHPMPLEGSHAIPECIDCHVEGPKVSPECSTCHQPPSEPHFGADCQQCHTPTTFKDAQLPPELHPIPLVGPHATAACADCHADQEKPEYVCSNCHERPENHLPGECSTCHTPEGLTEMAGFLVSLAPQIPHELDGLDDCMQCHAADGQIRPVPANHVDYTIEQCLLCHKKSE